MIGIQGTGDVLLSVRDVAVQFEVGGGGLLGRRKATLRAVDGVSLDVRAGETVGLVGESGSGKTTLARTIVRLQPHTQGVVSFEGVDVWKASGASLHRLRRKVQMVFQDPSASLDPRLRVGSSVGLPLDIHHLGTGAERRQRVAELLTWVGLHPDDARRYPHELSGGQRQRVGIARALALDPSLIVADEPVSALDVSIRAQIVNLLEDLQARLGLSYLLVAHDLSLVRHVSSRVAVMYLGQVVEFADTDRLFDDARHPYTRALLSAIPVPNPHVEANRKRIILQGDIPSPVAPPSGCRFHTRCWLRERLGEPDACVNEAPPLQEWAPGHLAACHFSYRIDDNIPLARPPRLLNGREPGSNDVSFP